MRGSPSAKPLRGPAYLAFGIDPRAPVKVVTEPPPLVPAFNRLL
jgi:hypothetical protein